MALDIHQIEEELEELESRIDRLRALYEQYFMGIEKLEPQIPRKDVERRIHALRKEKLRNTGQRFRFQMLAQRYNTLQQHWGRVVREIEKGTYRRGVARGAQRLGTAEPVTDLARRRQERYAALAAAQAEREHGRRPPPAEPVEEPQAPEPIAAPQVVAPPPPPRPPPLSPGLGLFFRGAPAAKPALAQAPAPVASTAPSGSLDGARRAAALAAGLKARRSAQQTALSEPLGLVELDAPAATPPAARAAPSPGLARPAPSPSSPRLSPRASQPAPVSTPRASQSAPVSTPVTPPPALQRSAVPAAPSVSSHRPAAAARPPAPTPSAPDQARPDRPEALPEGRVRQIYNQYVESRRAANESTAGLTYDKLARTLEAQSAKLRANHATRSVDFEVEIKNGRTVLKPVLR